jgi:hypothetical protein
MNDTLDRLAKRLDSLEASIAELRDEMRRVRDVTNPRSQEMPGSNEPLAERALDSPADPVFEVVRRRPFRRDDDPIEYLRAIKAEADSIRESQAPPGDGRIQTAAAPSGTSATPPTADC